MIAMFLASVSIMTTDASEASEASVSDGICSSLAASVDFASEASHATWHAWASNASCSAPDLYAATTTHASKQI